MNTWYAVANAKQWLKAVVVQGSRLLDTQAQAMEIIDKLHGNLKSFQDAMDIERDATDIERMEQYFFIIAVNKAREWLNEAASLVPELHSLAIAFEAKTPFAKEVRNMREHEIDYFKNRGHAQDNFVRSVGPPGRIAADASASIIREGAYFIGGRLNVQVAMAEANRSYPKVKERLDTLPVEGPAE